MTTTLLIILAAVVALQWLGSRVQEELIRHQEKLIEAQRKLIEVYEKTGLARRPRRPDLRWA